MFLAVSLAGGKVWYTHYWEKNC